MGPEEGYDPSRTIYLMATTGDIKPSASPEDSGLTSNILNLILVPHFRFELNLPLYEGRVSTVEARQIWQGIA